MPRKDMTGQKFGKITVVEYSHYEKERSYWKCVCECGNEKTISGQDLRRGHAKSCGCYNYEHNKTHGLSGTRLYNAWTHMIHRCYDISDINYKNYGGRGIFVCEEWRSSYETFYIWAVSNGYEEHLTLERMDVNANYSPSNCKWITMDEQRLNKRDTVRIIHKGESITLVELSRITGIPRSNLAMRYKHGDRDERLVRPIKKRNKTTKRP